VSEASSPQGTHPARYVEVNKRLSRITGSGAALITALTVAAAWGKWRALAIVAAIQVLVIAFNIWVNLSYLPRRGRSAEVVRAVVNLTTSVVTNHLAGWPVPVWLWLPFVALAFDHLDRRVARWALVGMCVVEDTAAVLEGVPWIYPVSFTAFAVFCSEVSRIRFLAIRDMLARSDQQRVELEATHTSLREAHEQLTAITLAREQAEQELRQAHKLEAVGRLAAGVAHEINTPVQFVGDSVEFLRTGTADLIRVVDVLRAVRQRVLDGSPSVEMARASLELEEELDLSYLVEHLPLAGERALDGTRRVAFIVRSMRDFAHPDSAEMAPADLNEAIASTLTIAESEYKHVAELVTDYGDLPPVCCHVGAFNQALLNIVVNAAHAIGDAPGFGAGRGTIVVRTRRDGDDVVVSVADTGGGIPEAVRERIFDPFFTTKEVGRGTGQGLSVARTVIAEKHHGSLRFETEVGKGTTFFIRLPLRGSDTAGVAKPSFAA